MSTLANSEDPDEMQHNGPSRVYNIKPGGRIHSYIQSCNYQVSNIFE